VSLSTPGAYKKTRAFTHFAEDPSTDARVDDVAVWHAELLPTDYGHCVDHSGDDNVRRGACLVQHSSNLSVEQFGIHGVRNSLFCCSRYFWCLSY